MPQTVEVRFKGMRRDFYRWPDDQEPLRLREAVVVECQRGQDLGRVHSTGDTAAKKCGGCSSCGVDGPAVAPRDDATPGRPHDAIEEHERVADRESSEPSAEPAPEIPADPSSRRPVDAAAAEFRPVIRRATQDDVRVANDLRRSEEDARRQAMEKVRQHQLDMKVSDAEWQWDRSKLTLFFTAEKRVDFRALVRDLASLFRTRIELRQIGVRDEAARLRGVGRCGREYCCSTWLTELSPVSLALAKDQHLSLNPAQISGGCGRLLCCLKYEHEFYVAARKRFPREGKTIMAARGSEKVIAVDIFRERVFLRNEEGPRIIPLVQLREEMDQATARQDEGSPRSQAPVEPAAPPKAEPPGRRVAQSPNEAARRPVAEPPRRPVEPAGPGPEPAGEAQSRKRRRRRGRRGRRGNSGGSPPPSAPET
jgi:cell fate regulator YaaT (PSP1 superfamily)